MAFRKKSTKQDSENDELNEGNIQKFLNSVYNAALQGNALEKPLVETVEDYSSHHQSKESTAKAFIDSQVRKCGSVGFLTGFGGIATLPLAVGADFAGVLYLQMRMVAGVAAIGGYDPNSDQVRTLVYFCLMGNAMSDAAKSVGIKLGAEATKSLVGRIPGSLIYAINKKIGFYFLTRFGSKGVVRISNVVPVVGGVISGGVDVLMTKAIARNAYKEFISESD